ncbi:SH3 domain-binding protein 5-like [Acropora cervicornis]|uniref:SH3 domain-binding protein 5-like n=1 Tax=Acropora cervicornis TaxID=6130 RepID=A0AAD9QZQ5_ACRCE|nr:SH3 domain-binding protein 5-like [Acropora cervicornis]
MATNTSQPIPGVRENRESSGGEDDSEEILDPRVKGELDRLNSSTAEINHLEQDLEELQAAFRQTLTESAYVLNSQAALLGKCVSQARPYYDAMREAKQIETQRATLKYERACSVHQAAKKMLAMAEQKLVSTSKEHKVLDPSWQEMLNQAVFKVTEADKNRALQAQEHLHTARAFSEAGNKVMELRSKLKSAIKKSRPYFDLKMKYDQILETRKGQVEVTQQALQEAKRKYSLALKNLEGISEEIHEMRRSRESLNTILLEREEGVGAESPEDDTPSLSSESWAGCGAIKPNYGFKIALVSASAERTLAEETAQFPVGERDEDPEGCNSVDEQQRDCDSGFHATRETTGDDRGGNQEKMNSLGLGENTVHDRDEPCSSEICSDLDFRGKASGEDFEEMKVAEVKDHPLEDSKSTDVQEVAGSSVFSVNETSKGSELCADKRELRSEVSIRPDHSSENAIRGLAAAPDQNRETEAETRDEGNSVESYAIDEGNGGEQTSETSALTSSEASAFEENVRKEERRFASEGAQHSISNDIDDACGEGQTSETSPRESSEETVSEHNVRKDERDGMTDVDQRPIDSEHSNAKIGDACSSDESSSRVKSEESVSE